MARCLDKQPEVWKERSAFGALDMSATYAAVYSVILPKAAQVVDPFHVVSLANRSLDPVRRRVTERPDRPSGVRDDPLYRARRAARRRRESRREGRGRLRSLLELGDPGARSPSPIGSRSASRLLSLRRSGRPARCSMISVPLHQTGDAPEIQRLGRTIRDWFDKICNFHVARVSNGPTEALNNLIKRIKRMGFGFRNFENYRIRVLLYAGSPNWRVLGSIVVR